jgi:hypothetical protein
MLEAQRLAERQRCEVRDLKAHMAAEAVKGVLAHTLQSADVSSYLDRMRTAAAGGEAGALPRSALAALGVAGGAAAGAGAGGAASAPVASACEEDVRHLCLLAGGQFTQLDALRRQLAALERRLQAVQEDAAAARSRAEEASALDNQLFGALGERDKLQRLVRALRAEVKAAKQACLRGTCPAAEAAAAAAPAPGAPGASVGTDSSRLAGKGMGQAASKRRHAVAMHGAADDNEEDEGDEDVEEDEAGRERTCDGVSSVYAAEAKYSSGWRGGADTSAAAPGNNTSLQVDLPHDHKRRRLGTYEEGHVSALSGAAGAAPSAVCSASAVNEAARVGASLAEGDAVATGTAAAFALKRRWVAGNVQQPVPDPRGVTKLGAAVQASSDQRQQAHVPFPLRLTTQTGESFRAKPRGVAGITTTIHASADQRRQASLPFPVALATQVDKSARAEPRGVDRGVAAVAAQPAPPQPSGMGGQTHHAHSSDLVAKRGGSGGGSSSSVAAAQLPPRRVNAGPLLAMVRQNSGGQLDKAVAQAGAISAGLVPAPSIPLRAGAGVASVAGYARAGAGDVPKSGAAIGRDRSVPTGRTVTVHAVTSPIVIGSEGEE